MLRYYCELRCDRRPVPLPGSWRAAWWRWRRTAPPGRPPGRASGAPARSSCAARQSDDGERAALGRLLFWEPVCRVKGCRLRDLPPSLASATRTAWTCRLAVAWAGTARISRRVICRAGQAQQPDGAQCCLQRAHGGARVPATAPMFWDSRVRSLEAQALEPLKAPTRCRAAPRRGKGFAAVARGSGHSRYAACSLAPRRREAVRDLELSRACRFERTLVAADSPFDRYMRGDRRPMTPDKMRGMDHFRIGCADCHSGPMFTDFSLRVLASLTTRKLPSPDTGSAPPTRSAPPSLRNLGVTGPCMHSGVLGDRWATW